MSFRNRNVFVAALAAALFTGHAALAIAAPPAYKSGEVIVRFRDTVTPARRQAILQDLGSTNAQPLGKPNVQRVRFNKRNVDEAIAHFRTDPDILYIQPNYVWQALVAPNDPRFPEMWGLENHGQTGGTPGADIRATSAWAVTTGSSNVLVGVIDTGVDYNHPDLAAHIYTNPGEIPANGVDDDGNGYVDDFHGWDFVNNDNDPMDDIGHGTHVAGTIGAIGNNGIGTVGVCWDVTILPLKFLGPFGGTTADAVRAVRYATAMHVRLTSNSWGGGGYDQALYDAIAEADSAGILFVAASANNGLDTDIYPNYPSAFDLPNIVAVAATDHNDQLAFFSNYGATTVDLAAPGVDILSTFPNNSYGLSSGTSMATPHVSGALALMFSRFPSMSAVGAKSLLLSRVTPLPGLAGKMVSGGRLDAFLPVADPDSTPPAAISDLRVASIQGESAVLAWTATGDDGHAGRTNSYDVRYSTSPIDESNFASATRAHAPLTPAANGVAEQDTIPGLQFLTTYYFAVRALDEFGNASSISNEAFGTTAPPPDIGVTPTSVSAALLTGEIADRSVTVSNSGPSELRYKLQVRTGVSGAPAVKWRSFEASTRRTDDPKEPPPAAGPGSTYRPAGMAGRPPSTLAHTRVANVSSSGALRIALLESGSAASVLRTLLQSFPDVAAVDEIDVSTAPPSLATLAGYDAVILIVNVAPNDRSGLGNVLADYADGGGGVILTLASFINGWNLTGRLLDDGYMPFTLGSGPGPGSSLGTFDADHPIMRDVTAASGDLLGFTTLAADAELVASWASGQPFVATKGSTVVGVNAFLADPGFWGGDVPLILHNAVLWSQGAGRWLTGEPRQGVVTPGSSLVLAVRLNAAGLDGGPYDGRLDILSNDPDEPVVSVAAHLDVTGAPDLAVTIEPNTMTSARDFSANGDSTRHTFDAQPIGPGDGAFALLADGDYGDFGESATLTVEGTVVGSIGATGFDCSPATGAFPVTAAQLAEWRADGHIDAIVSNTFNVDPFCTLNRHTVTLSLPRPVDPLEFGTLFVGLQRSIDLLIRNAGTESLVVSSLSIDNADFHPSFTAAVVAPRTTRRLTITFQPSAAHRSTGTLRFSSNDAGTPLYTLALAGDGILPPDIAVAPTSLTVSVPEGASASRLVHVSNVGASDLTFDVDVLPSAGLPPPTPFAGLSPAAITAAGRDGEPKYRVTSTVAQALASSPVPVTCIADDPAGGAVYAQQNGGQRFFRYVASANRWDELPPSPILAYGGGGATLLNGRVYTSFPYLYSLGVYDVASSTWSTIDAPFGTTGLATDGTRYLYLASDYRFIRMDPVALQADSLPTAPFWFSNYCGLRQFENKIYGYAGSGYTNFAVFDLASEAWRTLPSLPEYPTIGAAIDPIARTFVTGGPYGGKTVMRFGIDDERWTVGTMPLFGFSSGGFGWLPSPIPGVLAFQGDLGRGVARIVDKPDFITVVPLSGRVAPGATLDLDVRFDSGGLLGGVYHANLAVASNDPDEATVNVAAQFTVIGTPDLAIGGEPIELSSRATYFFSGDSTRHALPLSVPPGAGGVLRLDYSGDYGDPTESATVIVEGKTLGVAPSLGGDCLSGRSEFTVSAADMTLWAQDGVVNVLVANSRDVDAFCSANEHLVTLSYAASATRLDFGEVFTGVVARRTLQVSNRGSAPLVIGSIASDRPQFSTSAGSLTVPPRSTTMLEVRFAPTTVASLTATLTFTSNDPDTPILRLPLSGSGVLPPRATVAPLLVSESVAPGETIVRALTLGNTGGSELTFEVHVSSGIPGSDSLGFAGLSHDSVGASNNPVPHRWGSTVEAVSPAAAEPRFHAQSGELLALSPSPVTLTCIVGDPLHGVLYGQENNGTQLYRYDAAVDRWSPLSPSPVFSGNNGGAALLRGRVYTTYTGPTLMGVYQIDTGQWSTMPNPLGRGTGDIASDGDRYLYLAEGFDLMRWDVETGQAAALPSVPMYMERWGGLVFFEGALYAHSGNGTSAFARFDIQSQQWSMLPFVPGGAVLGSAIDPVTREYVAYGSYGGNNLYRYSLDRGTWGVSTMPYWYIYDGGMAWLSGAHSGVYMVEGEIGTRMAVLIGLPLFIQVDPLLGSVAPAGSQALSLRLGDPSLPPGMYHAGVGIDTNDPLRPHLDVPVSLEIRTVPLMALSGAAVELSSDQSYVSTGAVTTHTIVLPERPTGLVDFGLLVEGDYSDPYEIATLIVEGVVVGIVGGIGADCVPASVRFSIPDTLLTAILADDRIDAIVQNSFGVDAYCPVNRHVVTVTYHTSITPMDFGPVFVGGVRAATISVRNTGTAALTVQPPQVVGSAFTSPTGTLVVAPGEEAAIEVRFAPTHTGTFTGSLLVRSDAFRSPDRTVELRGEGITPPILGVNPSSFAVRLGPDLILDRTLRIRNTGGAPLHWNARRGAVTGPSLAKGSVLASEVVASRPPADAPATSPGSPSRMSDAAATVPVASASASRPAGSTVTQTVPSHPQAPPSTDAVTVDPALADILSGLNTRYEEVTSVIPDRFDFMEGEFGYQIVDGGSNLFDGGNILTTSLGGPVSYANNTLRVSSMFGVGGRYFTRKYPGLFVLAADIRSLPEFAVFGNLGADGRGAVAATVLQSTGSGRTWTGFSKRVFGAGVPSVNHLIIVEDRAELMHDYDAFTDSDYHRVTGLATNRRLYYLMYSGGAGAFMDDVTTLEIMDRFLDIIDPSRRWVSTAPSSGVVPPGEFQDVAFRFDTHGLVVGDYSGSVILDTNAPATPTFTIDAELSVVSTPVIEVRADSLDFGTAFVGFPTVKTLTVQSVGGAPLTISAVTSSRPDVTAPIPPTLLPGASVDLSVTALPTAPGSLAGTLTVASNDPSSPQVTVALTGSAVRAPQLDVAPMAVSEIVSVGFSRRVPLRLCNSGGWPLTFNVQADSTGWLSLSSPAGELTPGACVSDTLTLNAAGLSPGIYVTTLRVYSTDPDETEIDIQVQLRVVQALVASLDLHPETLNPKSNGRWVTAHITLPAPYSPDDIVISTVRLMGTIPADGTFEAGDPEDDSDVALGVRPADETQGSSASQDDMVQTSASGRLEDPDSPQELVLKFSRAALIQALPPGDNVQITVAGEVSDGRGFVGHDSLRVIRPKLRYPNGGEHLTTGSTVVVTWDVPSVWHVTRAEVHWSGDNAASWHPLAVNATGGTFSWHVPGVVTNSARLRVLLFDVDELMGTDDSDGPFSMTGSVTDAGALDDVAELALIGGTPNPFHASTRVRYALPRASRVRLEVFDLGGRRCRVLENGEMPAGRHEVAWNGRDAVGRRVAAGVYLVRMEADGRVLTRRIARLD